MNFIENIPLDIIYYIFTFLKAEELGKIAQLNKKWKKYSEINIIWKQLYFLELNDYINSKNQELLNINNINWKELYRKAKEWQFDQFNKLSCLTLCNNNLTVYRSTTSGCNPLIMTSKPFSKSRNYIQFSFDSIGSWLRIGIVDKKN